MDNRLPHKSLQPHYRQHRQHLLSDHVSRKEQTSVCAPELPLSGQHDSNVDLSSHKRISKIFGDRAALVSTILGIDSASVKEEPTPSSADELSELFFDWSDAESNLRPNALNLWDISYPSPDDSILCPTTPNRGDATLSSSSPSDSLVNAGGFGDWKEVDAIIPGFLAEDTSIAVTPYASAAATSSGCGSSTDGDDGTTAVSAVGDHRFPGDGSLLGPSPEAMAGAATANEPEGGESCTNDVNFHRKNGFLRDYYSPTEDVDEWIEAFVDSNDFHTSTHFAGYSSPSNALAILSFPRDFI